MSINACASQAREAMPTFSLKNTLNNALTTAAGYFTQKYIELEQRRAANEMDDGGKGIAAGYMKYLNQGQSWSEALSALHGEIQPTIPNAPAIATVVSWGLHATAKALTPENAPTTLADSFEQRILAPLLAFAGSLSSDNDTGRENIHYPSVY